MEEGKRSIKACPTPIILDHKYKYIYSCLWVFLNLHRGLQRLLQECPYTLFCKTSKHELSLDFDNNCYQIDILSPYRVDINRCRSCIYNSLRQKRRGYSPKPSIKITSTSKEYSPTFYTYREKENIYIYIYIYISVE